VSPVKYELDSYIPEDDILHSHHRENLRTYDVRVACVSVDNVAHCLPNQARRAETSDDGLGP
jgi:hypothetical protein